MTLKEYLNQTDPQRMPKVVLNTNEYIKHQTFRSGVNMLTMIEIPSLFKKFGISGNYIQVDNYPELYAIDEHGNKKGMSCFRLN